MSYYDYHNTATGKSVIIHGPSENKTSKLAYRILTNPSLKARGEDEITLSSKKATLELGTRKVLVIVYMDNIPSRTIKRYRTETYANK